MTEMISAGKKFREAMSQETPLQCVGAINAYHARLAEASGYKSLYISGGGVAAGSCGIPDLGITTMEDVLTDLRRITAVTELPVLVDIDTGWGGGLQYCQNHPLLYSRWGRGCPYRRSAGAKTLWSQAQQSHCLAAGNG